MAVQPIRDLDVRNQPNVEVVEGLRQIADWLEAHPELPRARWATVSLRAVDDGQPARRTLHQVAGALGLRAIERRTLDGDVDISGRFGPVRVRATAALGELCRFEEDYEPILDDAPTPLIPNLHSHLVELFS